ncbi:hypothetical protein TNCV_2359801 [Trichonephila clavipes]|nr:hypothetical protein TNCV_2359801 [Trichonephila clavipes]
MAAMEEGQVQDSHVFQLMVLAEAPDRFLQTLPRRSKSPHSFDHSFRLAHLPPDGYYNQSQISPTKRGLRPPVLC